MDKSDELETNTLSDRQKYKIVTPILVKIGNLISSHSTNQFYQYLDDLGKFEKKVRRGRRLNSRDNGSSAEAMPNNDESLESQQPSLLNEPFETNSAVTTSEITEPTSATTENSTESATTFEAAAELISAHGS